MNGGSEQSELDGAVRFFRLLAKWHDHFGAFQRTLWRNFDHKQVGTNNFLVDRSNGPEYSLYVHVDDRVDRSVEWCFEMTRNSSRWIIQTYIASAESGGQNIIREFPVYEVRTMEELEATVEKAIAELLVLDVLLTVA